MPLHMQSRLKFRPPMTTFDLDELELCGGLRLESVDLGVLELRGRSWVEDVDLSELEIGGRRRVEDVHLVDPKYVAVSRLINEKVATSVGACIRGVGDLGSIDGLHPKTNTLQSILRDAWSERGKKWSQAIALVWACMLRVQASGLHAIQLTLESGLIPWLVVSRCFDESAFHCIFSAELHRTYFDWHPTIAK